MRSNSTQSSVDRNSVLEVAPISRVERFQPFSLTGQVVLGEQRGTELGFPTANLALSDSAPIPAPGVYACRAQLTDGVVYPAATNVGVRPMFDSRLGMLVEAHLVGFDGDLYGQRLRLQFLQFLRPEQVFATISDLLERIALDVAATEAICRAAE